MEKEITVAIPVFNGEEFILDALMSIVDQTHKVNHIIISDNKSNDKTVEIVNQFIKSYPEINIHLYINKKNIGVQKNLNKCLELTQSDYLLILCADDKLKPYTIENQIKFFNDRPELALVGGLSDLVDVKGNSLIKAEIKQDRFYEKGQIFEFVKDTGAYIPLSTILCNMTFIRKIGYFDIDMIAPDEIFWPKVLRQYPIALLGQSLMDRRFHKNQEQNTEWVFKQKKMMSYFNAKMDISNYESNPARVKETMKELKKFISYHSMVMGEKSWNEYRKTIVAFKYWVYSFKLYPARIFTKRYLKNWVKLFVLSIVPPSNKPNVAKS